MAKVFTQEEREKIKGLIVEFVRLNGRGTIRQLSDEIGVSHKSVGRLCMELAASGDVYNSGYGVFPSEQARKDWQNARKKLSRAKLKKPSVVDPDLIWLLPDGEIRRYDRRQNIICRECRKSEVMQRILSFYQGNFQEVAQ
ncbi:DUF977 family protein [Escherichia coli]|uniref:DUF977 family protein n=2 Tax=Enterobacteriaceae TaxID=543 RepID=A0A8B3K245_SHISO|nr:MULTISPECIES: DUF977 family protein [Enterobacteriaceae]HDR9914561.1 DUF977 family protein [Escherichia coli 92.0144 (F03)]EFK3443364.1 DUF977 family protein [Escherichia coli]EHY3247778.1 DUF977 family protein [Escherichia coli]EME0188391.1 DUF977 family protein [Escherichia coli]EYD89460.1 hypothetical protein AB98_1880 [Escherichia coli 1-176-05_S3_C1]